MTDPNLGISRGIEVLTSWLEADGTPGSQELFWSRFDDTVDEGVQAEVELTIGLAKLASILLIKASASSGETPEVILRNLATRYAG